MTTPSLKLLLVAEILGAKGGRRGEKGRGEREGGKEREGRERESEGQRVLT